MLDHGLIQENHGINDLYHEAMQYNICLLHGSPRVIKLQPYLKCATSRICMYYFIVLSCRLHSGI